MGDENYVPALLDVSGRMARFRDGRWYDTSESSLVSSYRSGDPGGLDFVEEQLYQTVDGAFFLIGRGGSKSEWGVHLWTTVDGETVRDMSRKSGAKDLRVLTDVEAESWGERRGCHVQS